MQTGSPQLLLQSTSVWLESARRGGEEGSGELGEALGADGGRGAALGDADLALDAGDELVHLDPRRVHVTRRQMPALPLPPPMQDGSGLPGRRRR